MRTARSVLAATSEAGLDAEWIENADVPFPFHGGVRLRDQAQIDPMPVLNSLVTELEAHRGRALEGVRVTSISGTTPLRIGLQRTKAADGSERQQVSIKAAQCVLATGIPILDRGGFFARVKPQRSCCLAFDVPGDITRPMFISVDTPTRSVRYAPSAGGEKLIVGGAGHTVGRSASAAATIEELPYMGSLLPKSEKVFIATGFDK